MKDSRGKSGADEGAKLAVAYDAALPQLRRLYKGRSVDVDDIAQEAFLHALGSKSLTALANPLGFLLRIARNLVIDQLRARTRAFSATIAAGRSGESAPIDPERILSGRQELDLVLSAIEGLPPRCREAFTLRRIGGLSHSAIARQMGISTRMVELHVAEAMLRLARVLAETDDHGR